MIDDRATHEPEHAPRSADDLLYEALERPAPARQAFLTEACARIPGGAALLAEVTSLLRAYERAGGFLSEPALLSVDLSAAISKANAADQHHALIDRHLGPYRIVRRIGSGGMGDVYAAQRDDEAFEREVAVKVIRPGLLMGGAPEMVRRFEQERRLLAGLDHPGIARLIDGGSTDDGEPYLIMEYVDGEPINTFCDQRRLSIDQRLDVFLTVCDAVQFAHRNLIVHRDLKPANILVRTDGDATTVKLLDFGIAKLLSDQAPTSAEFTTTLERRLTPAYASPEQVRPHEDEPVTTASDVYSLGVILYELLTGRRPYRAGATSPRDMEKAVCDDPPTRPSDVVRTNGSPTVNCGLDPLRLQRRLHGDLETIILKALRKEPDRRYSSVEQLAEDIRRHRRSLPITARPDTLAYRASRFIKRNRVLVAAAACVALLLLGSLAAITALYVQADAARADAEHAKERADRRFQQVRSLARTMMFDMHDEIEMLAGATDARALLIQTSLAYLDALAEETGDDPALLDELASGYDRMGRVQGLSTAASLGNPAAGLESLQRAESIRLRLESSDAPPAGNAQKLFAVRLQIARMLSSLGREVEALARFEQLTADAQRLHDAAPDDPKAERAVMLAHNFLGNQQLHTGDVERAMISYTTARAIAERMHANDPHSEEFARDAAIMSDKLGDALLRQGKPAQARDAYARYLHDYQARVAAHPENAQYIRDLALVHQNLGQVAEEQDDLSGSANQYLDSLTLLHRLEALDADDATVQRDLSILHERLARVERWRGNDTTALQHFQTSYDISVALAEKTPDNVSHQVSRAWCGANVAWQLSALGSPHEAHALLTACLDIIQPIANDQPPTTFSQLVVIRISEGLVRSLLALDRPTETEPHVHRMEELARRRIDAQPADPDASALMARAHYCRAAVLSARGSLAEAAPFIAHAERLLQERRSVRWSPDDHELFDELQQLTARLR